MLDLTRHPGLLRLLSYVDRARRFVLRTGVRQAQAQAEQELGRFYRRVWQEAAAQLGATVEDLGTNVLEIRLGDSWTRVCDNCSSIDDLATHRIVRIKPLMYRLLASNGLPVPAHLEFTIANMEPAVAFLERGPRECVIKPACGTGGGLGVTTGVRTRWQLARAAWIATVHGEFPVIEEQVEGQNYRLLYLDGELLDVVKREPPGVVADGTSTVGQMVDRLNQERLRGIGTVSHVLLTLDLELQSNLRRQGLSFRSVPPRGTFVKLKTSINENSALDNVTATTELCDSILRDAALATQVSGLRLAGVDIITKDPRLPLRASGGVILEVNSPPGYFWHYHKRDGSFPVALHVLRTLLQSRLERTRGSVLPLSPPGLSFSR